MTSVHTSAEGHVGPVVDNALVMVVKTDNPGATASNQFKLPGYSISGSAFNATVDWGDGTTTAVTSANKDATHTYPSAGTYTVRIDGEFGAIFNSGRDPKKILEVANWGSTNLRGLYYGFPGATNLQITASDTPDVSNVQLFNNCFASCPLVSTGFEDWNMSAATIVAHMFNSAGLTADIGNWNMPNVTSAQEFLRGTPIAHDLSGITWGSLQNAYLIAYTANNLNFNFGAWDWSTITNAGLAFPTMPTATYDAALAAIAAQTLQPNVSFGAGGSKYTDAASRAVLTGAPNNWTVTDGGPA